jgi:MFS family permease
MVGRDVVTGSVFATMGMVAFVVLLLVGKLVDKIGSFKSILISMIFLGSGGLVLVLTGNIIYFWIAAAVFAIGEAIYGPAQAVLLTNYVESEHRGEIMGLDAVFDRILNTIAPFLAGFFLNYISPQKVLLLFILLPWLALISSWWLFKTKIKSTASVSD